jgi:hypothetical protein
MIAYRCGTMNRFFPSCAALVLIAALTTCSPISDPNETGTSFRTLETPDFVFLYTASDAAKVSIVAASEAV